MTVEELAHLTEEIEDGELPTVPAALQQYLEIREFVEHDLLVGENEDAVED